MESPAQLFRNELSQRLCTDTDFSLPNANLLVGVLIDAMEYNLCTRYHPLTRITLQNVLQVSREIECLGRMLRLNVRVRHDSIHALHPFTLQALYMLSVPATSLLDPCPEVVTLMTYVAVVHRLSSYIGARAVHDLVRDFNRTVPRKLDPTAVKKVPGIGPRVTRRYELGRGFGSIKLERVGELGVPPHMIYLNSPRRYRERTSNLHTDLRLTPFRLPEAHTHILHHMRTWELPRWGVPPPPQPQLLWPNPPPHSHLAASTFHEPHSGRNRGELTPITTPVLIPTLVLEPSLIDSYALLANSRASSPDPYRVPEEPDSNESGGQISKLFGSIGH